jgi:Helicase associated domain
VVGNARRFIFKTNTLVNITYHEEQVWQSNFQDLGHFAKHSFHINVHESHPLYHWANEQRIQYFKWCVGGMPHTMTIQRYTALQSLSFPFVQGECFRGLDLFLRFKKHYGCISNLYLWEGVERPPLQHWVYTQQCLYEKLTSGCQDAHIALGSEQIDLLDACGIIDKVQPLRSPVYRDSAPPSSLNEPWQSMFDILCEFKKTHGHCLIPFSRPELGPWVSDQRSQYKLAEVGQQSLLTAERIASLNGIGFTWGQSPDAKWMARYKSFLQYKTVHGHRRVPYIYFSVPGLGGWVAEQRRDYKRMRAGQLSAMNDTRIKLLEHAGLVWY